MPLDKKTLLTTVKEAKSKSKERKFTQSVDLILDIKELDMKAPEGRIQQIVELPHVTGKPNKICVFATGELALKARKSKADIVIEKAELEGIYGKKKQLRKLGNTYDVFIAEAPLMPLVGKTFGPVLGPRGKLPIPVPPNVDISEVIKKHRKTVMIRMRNQPIIQCQIGTEDMKDEELADNIQAVLRFLDGKLKRGLKNIKFLFIKTSMGTPVKIKP
ncbi:MAG: 50S ribosomal protein L1 [Candidatus Bathyarchaeota archaeon]|jgi:large subunit ribosomal protein L1|nr:50S ribosomal protein L1 [Candidatus Bathyarchaeota archaeon]